MKDTVQFVKYPSELTKNVAYEDTFLHISIIDLDKHTYRVIRSNNAISAMLHNITATLYHISKLRDISLGPL